MSEQTPDHVAESARQRRLIDAAWAQIEAAWPTRGDSSASRTHVWPDDRAAAVAPPASLPGYKLRREIHRGGQGVVYEAVQESTQRVVAIKVMRDGRFAGPRDRMRFEREVQILAQLRHPNIVAVHDSGVADTAAYFVMDFIAGETLDRFFEASSLSIPARIQVFARICDAVSAAHLRGVIHRDLKPANIRIDDAGAPHVLDFGLAKWTEAAPEHADRTDGVTMTGQFVGSLPWASPEQAEGRIDELDVRTDVYSLGVMLYQALTGRFPYRVSGSLRETTENIVKAEPADPRRINPALDAEVSAIVLKCLRKERGQRYQSAGELGRDLHRYLIGDPIEARGDSLAYVIRKQLARHRAAAGLGLAFALLVFAGLFVSLFFWRQAALARDESDRARARAEQSARQFAAEADRALAVSRFLKEMLTAADPTSTKGPQTTVYELLQRALKTIDQGDLAGEPLVEAAVRMAIGGTLTSLREDREAAAHVARALELRRRELGEAHKDVAECIFSLGLISSNLGDYAAAEAQYNEALAVLERTGDPAPELRAEMLNGLGQLLRVRGRKREAGAHLEASLALARSAKQTNSMTYATTLNNLALIVRDDGDLTRAAALFEEAMQVIRARHGDEHPYVAALIESIGSIDVQRGDFEPAIPRYFEALSIRRARLGVDHADYTVGLNNVGWLLNRAGMPQAALSYYEEALETRRRVLGPQHPQTAISLNNLALLLAEQGDYAAAEPLHREALAIKRARLGVAHSSTLLQAFNLANTLRRAGRFDEAQEAACEALAAADGQVSRDDVAAAQLAAERAASLLELARHAEAEPLLRDACERLLARLGAEHEQTRAAVDLIVRLYEGRGRPDEARAWRARSPADAGL